MTCRFCSATVADMAHHYAHDCRALAAAFGPGDATDPARSARQTAARYGYASSSPCARCGRGERVPKLPYCRPCRRLVCAESAARVRARGRA